MSAGDVRNEFKAKGIPGGLAGWTIDDTSSPTKLTFTGPADINAADIEATCLGQSTVPTVKIDSGSNQAVAGIDSFGVSGVKSEFTAFLEALDEYYADLGAKSQAVLRVTIPSDYQEVDGNEISVSVEDGGSGYENGDYPIDVPVTEMSELKVEIFVSNGIVQSARLVGEVPGGLCSSTFTNVPLLPINGVGVGATADITIDGDEISTCNIQDSGAGYEDGDILRIDSQELGGTGSGFQYRVTETDVGQDFKDTVYICESSGGSGSGLKARIVQYKLGGFSSAEVVDGGRDYDVGQTVTLINEDGPGSVSVAITRVG